MDRKQMIAKLTEDVGFIMQDAGYAYWSYYNQCWRLKKGPNLAGIVAAVVRAQEKIQEKEEIKAMRDEIEDLRKEREQWQNS